MTVYYRDEAAGITLHHARCEDVLPTLAAGSIDLVFTSPPYNLGCTTGGGMRGLGHYPAAAGLGARGGRATGRRAWRRPALAAGYDGHDDAMPHEEYVAWQHAVLRLLWPLLGEAGAIYYNHKPRILGGRLIAPLDYLPPELRGQVRQEVIWARAGGINHTGAFYTPTHERLVIVARDGFRLRDRAASAVGDVWYLPQERNTGHPAPFPLALARRALETTRPGAVLDPFCGRGTTLVAAKLAGRPAIGIERGERYCAMAARWLERARPATAEAVPLFDLVALTAD